MTEFEKYARLGRGINSNTLDRYAGFVSGYINPTVLEERKLNATAIDVFSRLLMDRIIWVGCAIDDDVATICTGMAASMGSVLLCAGTKGKRSALPHSRVMIHQPLGGVKGQAEDILIEAREIEKCRQELFGIISQHSGQPIEKVFADGDRNYWMTAPEALQYGMIDQIMTKSK